MRRIAAMLMFLFLVACAPQPPAQTGSTQQTGQGRVVFALTDAPANLEGVSAVRLSVDSIQVHSAADGWATVSSTPRVYNLLELKQKGISVLLADVKLKTGTYQQMRLDISNAVVVDASGEHTAKLPSGELKIVANLEVGEGTSSALLDFMLDKSLRVTGKSEYILAPVVRLETRANADVQVENSGRVDIRGGRPVAVVEVGMDLKGNVGVGLGVPADVAVEVDGGSISIKTDIGIGTRASLALRSKTGIAGKVRHQFVIEPDGIPEGPSVAIQEGTTIKLNVKSGEVLAIAAQPGATVTLVVDGTGYQLQGGTEQYFEVLGSGRADILIRTGAETTGQIIVNP